MNPKSEKKIILGIDPGLASMGYGVISWENSKAEPLGFGTINTKSGDSFSQRIQELADSLKQTITLYKPQQIVMERPIFCQNIQTALTLGQVSGAIIMVAAEQHIPIEELTPLEIKKAIVGQGRASKEQVQMMVQRLLHLDEFPQSDHAADALATALCWAHGEKFRKNKALVGQSISRRRRRRR